MGWIEKVGEWIGKQIAKPLEDIRGELKEIRKENAEQTEKLKMLDADTADLLCSQLTREHDFYLRQGWCPASDKRRLDDIYVRYKARGRNHLAELYMEDIVALPERPGEERRI